MTKEATAEAVPPPGAAADPVVRREVDGNVAILSMQHGPHNLLGDRLVGELFACLDWVREVGARAVVLRSGLRHFSAGAEMEAFASHLEGKKPDLPLLELLRAFDGLPVPIIASVHGICVGGGLELALASDFVIAAETAKLGTVEATLGLFPLMGAVQRITQRAGSARAKEMTMLARRYDAQTLERWNIINRVVPDDQLVPATMTLAHELGNGATVALAAIKALVSIAESEGVATADVKMGEVQLPIWASEDLKTGIASLNANGPGYARFEGR